MHTAIKIILSVFVILIVGAYGFYRWITIPPTQAKNPVVTGVHYVGVSVSNLQRTQRLYQESMDLDAITNDVIIHNSTFDNLAQRKGVVAKSSLMKSVNAQLRFMEFKHPSPTAVQAGIVGANGPGIAHICFQVNKKTHAYEHFLEGGATHIGTKEMIQINPKNPVYYAYANDPDNIMVEIEHVDVEALKLPTPPKNNFRIRHVSLATTDMERAVKFYSILLETKNPRRAGHIFKIKGEKVDKISGFKDSELEMAWFQVRNLELELIQYYKPEPIAATKPRPIDALGYNMIVFDVVSLAAVKEKLLVAGGTIVNESTTSDDDKILYARDLDGNLLGFQMLENDSIYSAKNFKSNGT